MGGGVNDRTRLGLQATRPVDNARRAYTALKLILLVKTKGCIASPSPRSGIGQGNITIRGLDVE